MTTPDPLALAEEAEEWVSGFTSPAAREFTAVVMVRCLAAALRAAHEENQRLRKALGPCPKRRLWEEHKDSTNAELRLAAQMCTPQKPCARCIALAGGKGEG